MFNNSAANNNKIILIEIIDQKIFFDLFARNISDAEVINGTTIKT